MMKLDNQQPSLKRKVQRLEYNSTSAQARTMSEYLNNIISVRDKKTSEEFTGTIDIQKIAAKYSNTKNPIHKLVLDNKPISRNNSYVIKYKCITCESVQEITANLYMRKVSNNGKCCIVCRNLDEHKISKHSEFMKTNGSLLVKGEYDKPDKPAKKQMSLADHIKFSNTEWNVEDDEFKERYYMHHLTIEDFNRIKAKIKDVNNKKITDLSGWEYLPHYRVWNQSRYTPMLVNITSNTIEKPLYITFDCENCGVSYCHRDLEVVKNKIKIYCKDCSFTNKTFKIRTMKLKSGEVVKWQSLQEKRFIEWCEEQDVTIKNGPYIPYTFNDVKKTYRVDFELPDYSYLVELKDNHCWYNQQIKSGQQPAKEKAANEWCAENKYKYKILFPKTIQAFKDSLKSCKI